MGLLSTRPGKPVSLMDTRYSLHVISVQDFPWDAKCFRSNVPNLYVKVEVGDAVWKTDPLRSNSPEWNAVFEFSSRDKSSIIKLRLKHRSWCLMKRRVGQLDIGLSSLLERCANHRVASLTLKSVGTLRVRIETHGSPRSVAGPVGPSVLLEPSGQRLASTSSITLGHSFDGDNEESLYEFVGRLLSKLDMFVRLIDAVSEIHPYVRVAWRVTSGLYRGISKQYEADRKIASLVQVMGQSLDFVHKTEIRELLTKNRRLEQATIRLLKQITECCLFVEEYTRQNFAVRMLDVGASAKIDEFEHSLLALKKDIVNQTTLHTAFVSSRTSSCVDALFVLHYLDPDKMDAFNRPQCLPGTRVNVLDEVLERVLEAKQNIVWLHGVAGCGKSTISTTVAEYFRSISRLGAFLFFEREKSEPSSVIRTLAHKLATFDSSIARHVIAAIEQDNGITSASAARQFEKLLLEPLTAASNFMEGPIIIILDALDECGTAETRRSLIELFDQHFSRLPPNFRFLVTSRREPDIDRVFSSRPESVCTVKLDYGAAVEQDVLHYIDHEMRCVMARRKISLPGDWPWESNMKLLAAAAEGLFVWASTAVKLVDSDNPVQRLKDLISNSRALSGLDHLYASILQNSGISFEDKKSKARFSQVIGLIHLSKIPLCDTDIDSLLGFPSDEPSSLILSRLQCVLAYEPQAPVRLFHTSFGDYLLSPERQGDPWFIDISFQKLFIASRCFGAMKSGLRFNICDLESSYVPNGNVPKLEDRIQRNIPTYLRYACLFYAEHLLDAPPSPALLGELSDFLRNRVLFWLEVLSLIKKTSHASRALQLSLTWSAIQDTEIAVFLRDARKLVDLFAFPISQSTPHIYLSALPLSTKSPKVFASYSEHVSSLVRVERKGHRRENPSYEDLLGYMSQVTSVVYSSNSERVISGFADKTVRAWDVKRASVIPGSFTGHTDLVTSLAFSSDANRIASGSDDSTVRIWTLEGARATSLLLKGHADCVSSVAFSPDGRQVVSGSSDGLVRVWDANNVDAASQPLAGHADRVNCVAFTLDGKRVISGSVDGTVREWDIERAEAIPVYLKEFKGSITSMAFSRDGSHLACGFDDGMIKVWNAKTGELVSNPFRGHRSPVISIAVSPDGACVVSGSSDAAVKVWDSYIGRLRGTFEGHTGSVTCLAFSPDGSSVASGSQDKTIRIWDVSTYTFDCTPAGSAVYNNIVSNWTLAEDGWIVGPMGELLLWVPPALRPTLWRRQNTAVLNCKFSTRLDFTNAALGERWQECYNAPELNRHNTNPDGFAAVRHSRQRAKRTSEGMTPSTVAATS